MALHYTILERCSELLCMSLLYGMSQLGLLMLALGLVLAACVFSIELAAAVAAREWSKQIEIRVTILVLFAR